MLWPSDPTPAGIIHKLSEIPIAARSMGHSPERIIRNPLWLGTEYARCIAGDPRSASTRQTRALHVSASTSAVQAASHFAPSFASTPVNITELIEGSARKVRRIILLSSARTIGEI